MIASGGAGDESGFDLTPEKRARAHQMFARDASSGDVPESPRRLRASRYFYAHKTRLLSPGKL